MPLLTIHNPLARLAMHALSVDKVNELYDRNLMYKGPDFARAVLSDLGACYEVENMENLETLPEGPFITVSNHPYGHMDGLVLMDVFGHLRPDYKVMVNGILGMIRTLEENFICVTPVGKERTAPTPDSVRGIKDAVRHVRQGHPLGLFPAGAVSDLSLKDRCIRDREWQEPVLRLIRKLNVPVLPVTFRDGNSPLYYSLGLIDWRVRLLRLPAEVFNKRGKAIRIVLGNIITPQDQDGFTDIAAFGRYLRDKVYELK